MPQRGRKRKRNTARKSKQEPPETTPKSKQEPPETTTEIEEQQEPPQTTTEIEEQEDPLPSPSKYILDYSGDEWREEAINEFKELMELGTRAQQEELENISKRFGYGSEDVKEKDLLEKLLTERGDDADVLDALVNYAIVKLKWWRELLSTLYVPSDPNKEIAHCLYDACEKFKGGFFALDDDLEKIQRTALRVMEFADDDEWLVTAGCKGLQEMLICWRLERLSTIVRRCLGSRYLKFTNATVDEAVAKHSG